MVERRPALPAGILLLTILPISILCLAGDAPAATLTTIHTFTGSPSDGASPMAGVFVSPGGVLYGTTVYGGTASVQCLNIYDIPGCGTVYSLTPPAAPGDPWTLDVFSLESKGVAFPFGGVVGSNGALYGTTFATATVFALKPPATPGGRWLEETINSAGPAVLLPKGNLAIGAGGVIYGTSYEGGTTFDQRGDVYSIAPPSSPGGAWTTTALCNLTVGNSPTTGVAIGSGGILHGTTGGMGTVYSLAPPASAGGAWVPTLVHAFAGSPGDGANSSAPVVVGLGGVLIGATSEGGTGSCLLPPQNTPGCGVVYSLRPPAEPGGDWIETILYDFAGGADGANPNAVAIGPGGILYGTTYAGGTLNFGTVYSLAPPTSRQGGWTKTILYSFTGGSDGANPSAGVAISRDGTLYGTTHGGGSSNLGTVFSLTP